MELYFHLGLEATAGHNSDSENFLKLLWFQVFMEGACQPGAVVCFSQSRRELMVQPFNSYSKSKEGSHGSNFVYFS